MQTLVFSHCSPSPHQAERHLNPRSSGGSLPSASKALVKVLLFQIVVIVLDSLLSSQCCCSYIFILIFSYIGFSRNFSCWCQIFPPHLLEKWLKRLMTYKIPNCIWVGAVGVLLVNIWAIQLISLCLVMLVWAIHLYRSLKLYLQVERSLSMVLGGLWILALCFTVIMRHSSLSSIKSVSLQ